MPASGQVYPSDCLYMVAERIKRGFRIWEFDAMQSSYQGRIA